MILRNITFVIFIILNGHLYAQISSFDEWLMKSKFYMDYEIYPDHGSNYFLFSDGVNVGLIDSTGKICLPAEFQHIESMFDNDGNRFDNYFIVYKNNLCGLYTKNGAEIIPIEYEYIVPKDSIEGGLFLVSKNYQLGLYSISGGFIFQPIYESIDLKNDSLYLVTSTGEKKTISKTELLKLHDSKTEINLVKANYTYYVGSDYLRNDSLFETLKANGSYPYSTCDFYRYGSKAVGIIQFRNDNKYGIVDYFGDTLLPPTYDYPLNFKYGQSIVVKNGKYGVVNKRFDEVIPPIYESVEAVFQYGYYFGTRVYIVKKDGLYGLIGEDGLEKVSSTFNVITPLKYWAGAPLNYLLVRKENYFGIIDNKGDTIIPIMYDKIGADFTVLMAQFQAASLYSEYWYPSKGNGDYPVDGTLDYYNKGVLAEAIDPNGLTQFKNKYDNLKCLPVKKNGKWGLSNFTNSLFTPLKYDSLYFLSASILCGISNQKYEIFSIEDSNFQTIIADTLFPLKHGLEIEEYRDPKQLLVYQTGQKQGVFDPVQHYNTGAIFDEIELCISPLDSRSFSFFYSEGWPNYLGNKQKNTNFHHGHDVIRFRQNGQYGLFNTHTFKIITKSLYDSIALVRTPPYYNEIIIQLNDKTTFLINDKNDIYGELFDSVVFLSAHPQLKDRSNWCYRNFSMDYSKLKVYQGDKAGVVDTEGKLLYPIIYEDINLIEADGKNQEFAIVKLDGKYGIINAKFELLVACKYSLITYEFIGDHKDEFKLSKNRKITWVSADVFK